MLLSLSHDWPWWWPGPGSPGRACRADPDRYSRRTLVGPCRFRQIWREAHHHVREFRRNDQKQGVGVQQRKELEAPVDRLGNLEFDLTFSIEFPLMRIESFHSALYQAMDLEKQADTLSRMFTQLAGSIRSEITAIDIRERQWDEYKQRWNAIDRAWKATNAADDAAAARPHRPVAITGMRGSAAFIAGIRSRHR